MTDLFVLEPSPKVKSNKPMEADCLREVMMALKTHQLVAWCERQNTGAAKVGGDLLSLAGKVAAIY